MGWYMVYNNYRKPNFWIFKLQVFVGTFLVFVKRICFTFFVMKTVQQAAWKTTETYIACITGQCSYHVSALNFVECRYCMLELSQVKDLSICTRDGFSIESITQYQNKGYLKCCRLTRSMSAAVNVYISVSPSCVNIISGYFILQYQCNH